VSNIWHEIFFHADKFVISYFLSEESMAYYALGYMICFPLTHFSTALATTLFRKFSAQNRINRQVFIVNSTFVVISVLIIIWLREFIILFLFSERYAPVTDLIIPLAMAFGFAGLSKPFTLYLMARKYGKVVRNISVIVPLIHIGMAWYIIPVYGINGAAWIAAMVYFLDLLLYMISYIRILPGESRT
jgi:O-antigen/teichoic acid export membrane protein